MKNFVQNIEKISLENKNFRKVLHTTKNFQLVVMEIPVGQSIGEEVHDVDQFLRIEAGEGKVILDGVENHISNGSAIIVSAGVRHNVLNVGDAPLKLYSLYSPPHHKDGTVHATKVEAEADDEHFDGVVSN